MGAPPDVIESALSRQAEEPVCWVYEENWTSVCFFSGLQTQWRRSLKGGYIGLDYAGVEAAMRLSNVRRNERQAMFADIRIMEFAALEVLNKKEK